MAVAFFALLWVNLWRQLSGEWSVNDQYSYGWFVPFFAIVLFWLRFADVPQQRAFSEEQGAEQNRPAVTPGSRLQAPSAAARAIAIVIALGALLLLFPVRLFEIGNPDWRPLDWLHAICVVSITLVFLWSVGGQVWLRHFAFAVAFILVAVPWVTPVEEPIVQGLMRLVAAIASETAALFGIPTTVQGNLIRVPSGLLGVNEACSGVRSLQTSLMIGLLFGELKRLSILRRAFLVAAAIAIGFVGNCLRAFFLVWVSATQNIAAAERWHDVAGYGIVAIVFLGTMILAWSLGRPKKQQTTEVRAQRSEIGGQFRISNFEFRISAAAIVWLIFTEIAAAGWYRAHERDLAQSARWSVQWPKDAAGFHEIKIGDDVRRILRFDDGDAATWTLPDKAARPLICTSYFFRWKSGKNSALLANLHRPDVCLPAIGWQQNADAGVKNYPIASGLLLPFRHFEFRHGLPDQPTQQTAHAFYCLWEDRVPQSESKSQLPNMAGASSAWTRDERVRAVLEGRRHLGQQVLEVIFQSRGAIDDKETDQTFANLLSRLIQVRSEN